jgi:translation initiation factor IF-1
MKKNKKNRGPCKEEDGIYVDGTVLEARPNAMFTVKLDNDFVVLCTICGKMRMKYIKVLPDDRVQVRLSEYDLTKGIIKYRYKENDSRVQTR